MPHIKTIVYRSVLLTLPLFSGFISACGSFSPGLNSSDQEISSGINLGSFGEPDQQNNSTRKTNSVESGMGLAGKSLLLDPIVRPFSTIKALYGLSMKSTSGFVERTFIDKVRLPYLEDDPIPPISNAKPMDLESWEQELDQLTRRNPINGNITLLVDGDEYFDRLNQSIADAQQSIDIRTYIFDNDDVALEMADHLREKSERVDVRILVDSLADLIATRLDSPSMPADIELPASISEYMTYASKVRFRKQSNPWFTGDHVKITVIDKDLAFLGGMNIGREYRYDWHDLMMEIDGPVVSALQHEFDKSWARAGMFGDFAWVIETLRGYQKEPSQEGYPIRIMSTSILNSELYRAQIAAIRRARNYIYIENAYFSDDKILFELARARRRGVDVRVILPADGDSGIINLSNQTAINTMLRNGIRVYNYPGMTHVKAAIYDGWACLGSANFDKLSLQINQEINLATSHAPMVKSLLERVFYPDFALATELHEPRILATRHHFAEMIADELF